jgi:hypothetical protein
VANPHLIYPGDVLALVYIDGRPQIILERGGATRLSPRFGYTARGPVAAEPSPAAAAATGEPRPAANG